MQIRNVAIVAHVDHGKTTLVDHLLRQSGAVRESADGADRSMDSYDQERERGITILAKNTSIEWQGVRINVVDTPGHADFGSEVERVLRMVDAVLLLVDAAEGPMPQTRFVLGKALAEGLPALVCINKIDRKDARPDEALNEVFDLFVALEATDEQLDFPHVYAVARDGWAVQELPPPGETGTDLEPLLRMLVDHVPPPPCDSPEVRGGPLQLQVATLDASEFLGRIAIGRVERGVIRRGMRAVVVTPGGDTEAFRVTKLMAFRGLERVDVDQAEAGDIVALAGAGDATVGHTICDAERPDPLPAIPIEKPTLSMTFGPNTSPFAGREGRYLTSRQIEDRLRRELLGNVGLRMEPGATRETFIVSGRGMLHISVLVEGMRREGYELSVSRPQVIERTVDGKPHEPIEDVIATCHGDHQGVVIQKLQQRGGQLTDLEVARDGHVRMEWNVPSRGLIGYRSEFLTDTRGTGTLHHVFSHYAPRRAPRRVRQTGVLVSMATCDATGYALFGLQERAEFFIGPGEPVYEGQIVGSNSRDNDLPVNPGRGKKLTNIRAAGSDDAILLTPPRRLTLEQALEFVAPDELVEVTPTSIRLRKRHLTESARKRASRSG